MRLKLAELQESYLQTQKIRHKYLSEGYKDVGDVF